MPTLSLSAPAAFSLDVPVELSCKEVSEDESNHTFCNGQTNSIRWSMKEYLSSTNS